MNRKITGWRQMLLAVWMLVWVCSMTAFAEGASGDNSLSDLGIHTEGVTVSPDFYYSTIEYNVTVPAGTTELSLDPVTSNPNATITDISGTTLENGEGTVVITVTAENGNAYSYYLYVKAEEGAAQTDAPQTESETQPQTEPQTETEPETEDPRFVKVDRNSLEEAENTIATLKAETASHRDRLNLLMKVLYGLIGFCVVLLFAVINLILKKRDLKAELREYRSYGYVPSADGQQDGAMTQYGDGEYGYQDAGYAAEYEDAQNFGGYAPEMDEAMPGVQPDGYNGMQQIQPGIPENDVHSSMAGVSENVPEEVYDDPNTVPKPSKARKKTRKMPAYQPPQQAPVYQPPQQDGNNKDVEITMIDL